MTLLGLILYSVMVLASGHKVDLTLPPMNRNHFVTLSARCLQQNQTIEVTLHTSEPFFGALYARDHQNTCRVRGSGMTATQLLITPGKMCGARQVSPFKNGQMVLSSSSKVKT